MAGCEVGGGDVGRGAAVEPHAHLPLPLGAGDGARRRVAWGSGREWKVRAGVVRTINTCMFI